MLKKISTLLVFAILLTTINLTVFANVINITRPDGNETTFKRSFAICGNTEHENVTVELSVYSNSTGGYVPLATVDGETSFKIGASGFFIKEVPLRTGGNKIRLFAFRDDDREGAKTYEFTITVLEESFRDKIKGGVLKVTEVLDNMFKKDAK